MKYSFNTKFKLSMLAVIAMFFLGDCTKQDRADYYILKRVMANI